MCIMMIRVLHNPNAERSVKMLKFKGYCVENKIKQSEIAELLEISVQSANKKINGKEPFTLPQVKKLCNTYHLSADEYFI